MQDKVARLFDGLPSRTLFNTGAMVIGGLIFSAAIAFADGSDATQSVVGSDLIMPYDGYLMVDSAPLTGVKTIKFDLYQDATGGTVVWTETQTVNLYNGRFSVGLGSSTSLTSTILDAEKLYLSMSIVELDAQGNSVEIELSGRQSIEPAPYAAWSAKAADLDVAGRLDVVGDANVGGRLDVDGDADVAGKLDVDGALTTTGAGSFTGALSTSGTFSSTGLASLNGGAHVDGGLDVDDYLTVLGADNDGTDAALKIGRLGNPQFGYVLIDNNEIDATEGELVLNGNSGHPVKIGAGMELVGDLEIDGRITPAYETWSASNVGAGGAAILNDNNTFKALMIVGNDSAVNGNGTAGDRRVNLYDDVSISGDLTVAGNFTNFSVTNYLDKTAQTTLTASSQSICYLSKIYLKGYNEASDFAECGITDNGTNWVLAFRRDETTVICSATCLSW